MNSTSLYEKTKIMMGQTHRKNSDDVNEYLIITDFGNSSIKSESGFAEKYFRIFTPVKEEKGRKLNRCYEMNFNPTNDSLMDYPTIISERLKKDGHWNEFNRLVSIHVSRCPLDCWHCYLEECFRNECHECGKLSICENRKSKANIHEGWITAKNLVDDFIGQRELDKQKGIHTNVLRITGGEPFLVPQLILEVLEEVESRNLHNEIYVWTETNLIPLAKLDGHTPLVPETILQQLSKHRNFSVHPCFHGLTAANFTEITNTSLENFDLLIEALKSLLTYNIDVYPSFGSNMSSTKDVMSFYDKISSINKNLPLRFALIEYDLSYNPIKWRRDKIQGFAAKHGSVHDRYQNIDAWTTKLFQATEHSYAEIPRQQIDLTDSLISENYKIAHLFHWPSNRQYQEKLLQIVALPKGSKGTISYNKKYVDENVYSQIEKLLQENDSVDGVFWVLNLKNSKPDKREFDFTSPIRKIKITKISETLNSAYSIDFIVQSFCTNIKVNSKVDLTNCIQNHEYNNYPGSDKGYVHLGPIINLEGSDNPDLETMYETILKDIESLSPDIKPMKDCPLVSISEIADLKPDYAGEYKISTTKEYKVQFIYYQGNAHRERDIEINGATFNGKSSTEEFIFQEKETESQAAIKIKIEGRTYKIPLISKIEKPLYKNKHIQVILFILVCLILALFFTYYILPNYSSQTNSGALALFTALIALVLGKAWDIYTKD